MLDKASKQLLDVFKHLWHFEFLQNEISGNEDLIDVTTDVSVETSATPSDPFQQLEKEPMSEEDLMKKGKLLFQHLKCSDVSSSTVDIA